MDKKPKAYVISVSAYTGCYRHIKIAADCLLSDLSAAILDAFLFIDDHAHAFFMDNRAWSDADSYCFAEVDEFDEERHTCDVTLKKAGLQTGKRFVYIFDFGDDWRFSCRVLKELDEEVTEPEVIRSKGEPPDQLDRFGTGRDADDGDEEE